MNCVKGILWHTGACQRAPVTPMLIDTHAHINLHAFKDDADEVLQRAFDAGITVINVGTEYPTSKQAVEMLAQYPQCVYAVVGLHPSHTYDNPYLDENESAYVVGRQEFDVEAFRLLARHERVVGIGECGFDYYRLPGSDANNTSEVQIKAFQKEAFLQQIQLAVELDKALVIHCRPSKGTNDAYDDVLDMLHLAFGTQHSAFRFEVHSFTGTLEVAKKFIDLGGYIGLNGIITFDKTGNMEEVVKGVPLERVVLETDAPYLAPVPNRGKRNEPLHVRTVAQKIAEWKNIEVAKVEEQTTKNAQTLFHLPI